MKQHNKQHNRVQLFSSIPLDILELVFTLADMTLKMYNTFCTVSKTWKGILSEEKWYYIVRCNSLLPITSKGQAAAMCAQGFGVFQGRRGRETRYDSDPWGIRYHLNHCESLHLKHWHVDVLNIVNDYIKGSINNNINNNIFCFNSLNVLWGRTEFSRFLSRMGAASDDRSISHAGHLDILRPTFTPGWQHFDRELGSAYIQSRHIKSQLISTVQNGLFPLVVIDIMSARVGNKEHMQHIANIIRSLKGFQVLGISVPVIVFGKRYGPYVMDIWPMTAASWFPGCVEHDMWYDTGYAETQGYAETDTGYPQTDSAWKRVI